MLPRLQSGKLNKRTGTPLYMAPELFMRYYGVESDQVMLPSTHNRRAACLHMCLSFMNPVFSTAWQGLRMCKP